MDGKALGREAGYRCRHDTSEPPQYLLLTDADIVHPSNSLTRLIMHAHANRLVLASLMVKLRCESFAERAFIPAFVFFFQMLYPFSLVNRAGGAVAAAAGGCMLVRADALENAGGVNAIRGALIDDCALARVLKRQGPIWLGLTTRVRSLRAYENVAEIRRMVVRSAYAQLRYSPPLLLATIFAMAVTYLVPPVIALFGSGVAWAMAVAAWGLMALAFHPTLRLYGRSPSGGSRSPPLLSDISSSQSIPRTNTRVDGAAAGRAACKEICKPTLAPICTPTCKRIRKRASKPARAPTGRSCRDCRRRCTFGQGAPG